MYYCHSPGMEEWKSFLSLLDFFQSYTCIPPSSIHMAQLCGNHPYPKSILAKMLSLGMCSHSPNIHILQHPVAPMHDKIHTETSTASGSLGEKKIARDARLFCVSEGRHTRM